MTTSMYTTLVNNLLMDITFCVPANQVNPLSVRTAFNRERARLMRTGEAIFLKQIVKNGYVSFKKDGDNYIFKIAPKQPVIQIEVSMLPPTNVGKDEEESE